MRREHLHNAGTPHKAETFTTADTDVYIPAFQWRMNPKNRFEHRPICVSLGGNMSKIQYKKTDPRIAKLIADLRVKSRENDALIWKDIAGRLERSRKSYATVNLSHINRHVAENETILVPGKVLGAGDVSYPMVVGAFNFSEGARAKITDAGGECLTIEELLAKNPAGSNMRIIR